MQHDSWLTISPILIPSFHFPFPRAPHRPTHALSRYLKVCDACGWVDLLRATHDAAGIGYFAASCSGRLRQFGALNAKVWVFDAKVEQANEVIPLREIEVTRVRSVPGSSGPFLSMSASNRRASAMDRFQNVQLVGLDTATFVGRPMEMLKGRIEDLRLPDAVIIDQVGVAKFKAKGVKIDLGTVFEINDKTARVVRCVHTPRSFLGSALYLHHL